MPNPGNRLAIGQPDCHKPWGLAAERSAKRAVDLLAASFGLIVLSPVMLLIAILIKLDSPGPVLYRGVRAGRYGVPFRILKFRTMVTDAESLGGPTTGTNDPRVTRIGRLLRRTKLDELPQLLNVLRGEMSLVGPRPEVLQYTNQYSQDEQIILSVRPGVTDLASIEFADLDDRVGANDPDAFFREHVLPRKNALRVKYIEEWTLWGDVRIILRTIGRVLRRAVTK